MRALPPRVVFITGCSTGIGRETARLFAQRGHRVIATARRVESLLGLEEEARSRGWSLRVSVCDLMDDRSMVAAAEFALSTFGNVEVLVNNAGFGLMGPIEAIPMSSARRQFEVNVFGAMRLVQLLAPGMRKAGWGRIINVSSAVGRMVMPLGGWYSASKFAIEALSDALRIELGPFGIHTVALLPGPVKTAFVRNIELPMLDREAPEFYRQAMEQLRKREHDRPFEVSAVKAARVIVRAAEAKRPRPRYLLTVPSRVGSLIRPLLTDRAWDRLIGTYYGVRRPASRETGGTSR